MEIKKAVLAETFVLSPLKIVAFEKDDPLKIRTTFLLCSSFLNYQIIIFQFRSSPKMSLFLWLSLVS